MGIKALVDVIHAGYDSRWRERNLEAFNLLFGGPLGRYKTNAKADVTVRAPGMGPDAGVPFAAYIHPINADSGAYGGLSFAIFPIEGQPSLVALVVGTHGLSPDEAILGKPGHARKTQAICSWLNRQYGNGTRLAWAKQDPTRTDIGFPDDLRKEWGEFTSIFDKYGSYLYALYRPNEDQAATARATAAFLDLMFDERGHSPLATAKADADDIKAAWLDSLMPTLDQQQVKSLLAKRRYVIVQGPPGTGKTRMATDLLRDSYGGLGRSIQFHPNTTYENFIGGLSPSQDPSETGLRFLPTPGALMQAAAAAARETSLPYLLHIDEINRADLAKILGEAIFLLEPQANFDRTIDLAYDFGPPFHRTLSLPKNLHILGTMNSADRSIAIVDVAVRRRFGFVSLWPRASVVDRLGCATMKEAFQRIISIFIEHAGDDAFQLAPGHSYFLESDESRAKESLLVNLAPLLEEYLAQGYVTGFAEPVQSYLQWLRAL